MPKQRQYPQGSFHMQIEGEQLVFMRQSAIFWPAQKQLFIADTHFGKDATFRRHGMSVPAGSDAQDLETINQMVNSLKVEKLSILGDFVHSKPLKNDQFPMLFKQWRKQLTNLTIEVVAGNHDQYVPQNYFDEQLRWITDVAYCKPFCLSHEPINEAGFFVLAGHIHPMYRLRSKSDHVRLPVFWIQPKCIVLPAFGSFTGGYNIKPGQNDKLIGVTPEQVIPLFDDFQHDNNSLA